MAVDPDDPDVARRARDSHGEPPFPSSSMSSQSTFEERSSTGDSPPAPGDDASPSSSSGDHDDTADSDTDAEDRRGGIVPRSGSSTVYVDLTAEFYHAREEHTGPDPAAFTRDQAEWFSFRACPECFDSGD